MARLNLLTDEPTAGDEIGRQDGLNFDVYARTLARAATETKGPFTVGVFGDWGSGKTSLMRMVRRHLDHSDRDVVTVWFNAWQYEREQHPIVPLIAVIVDELQKHQDLLDKLNDKKDAFIRNLRAIAYGFSFKAAVKSPVAEVGAGLEGKDIVERMEELTPDPLLEPSLYHEAFTKLSEIQSDCPFKIVVFIDDLDRCFPNRAIGLLEGIKLALAQPGFVFILGVARSVLEGYLEHRYEEEYGLQEFAGGEYLDKIVQLPFYLPPHDKHLADLCNSLLSPLPAEDQRIFHGIIPIISVATKSNPRTIVRFINNLLVDRDIYDNLNPERPIPLHFFATSRGLQLRWPDEYDYLSRDTQLCETIRGWDAIIPTDVNSLSVVEAHFADRLREDASFRNFLFDLGSDWLTQHSLRDDVVHFLHSTRSEPAVVQLPAEPSPSDLTRLLYRVADVQHRHPQRFGDDRLSIRISSTHSDVVAGLWFSRGACFIGAERVGQENNAEEVESRILAYFAETELYPLTPSVKKPSYVHRITVPELLEEENIGEWFEDVVAAILAYFEE